MQSTKVLLIEDEIKIAQVLHEELCGEYDVVDWVSRGDEGLQKAESGEYHILLIDIMLPKVNGIEIVRRLRTKGVQTPVIMLSARGELDHRIEGLDAGADDYLAKPFAISELKARIRAVMRRKVFEWNAMILMDDLVFDRNTREARRAGEKIELSTREALLLEVLLSAEGRIVSRAEIIRHVWQYDFDPGTNIVEVYIRRLREKIDRRFAKPLIHNVRGLGYQMKDIP